jgi:hypothetical protein
MAYGIAVKQGTGGSRVEIRCMHQNGLVYVVPAESNWVCTQDLVHAHALAGFFKDLTKAGDPWVRDLMQKWGLYFRERPLSEAEGEARVQEER